MEKERSARLYHCLRCHSQVIICNVCDRNNIYCGRDCAQTARQGSLREAGKRYQKTYRGRQQHASRQGRYRARQNEKVTHHTSTQQAPISSSQSPDKGVKEKLKEPKEVFCSFCLARVSVFLRTSYLSQTSLRESKLHFYCPQGP